MDKAKEAAALAAVNYILPDMKVGLGTGSTVAYFLEKLGQKCREGLNIQAIASSIQTEQIARELGIPIVEQLKERLDIVVDGADEIDPEKRLIKGGGGALLREKLLAYHSATMVVIADEKKLSDKLGHSKLPVEVVPFGYEATLNTIENLGVSAHLRMQASNLPFITDNGNYIIDVDIRNFPVDIQILDDMLHKIPGVVETGFFNGLAKTLLIGHNDGTVTLIN